MTKGPVALFSGGQEIIPSLSSGSAKSSNMSILILVVLSPILQGIIQLFKKIKFRKEIQYEQQLQQAVMSGVRNVYSPLVLFVGFLGLFGAVWFHLYVSESNRKSKVSKDLTVRELFLPIFWMTVIGTFMILVSFLRNPKLRFVLSHVYLL